MDKIWKFSEAKSDRVILIRNKTIYLGNLSSERLRRIEAESEKSIQNELFGIPYNYINQVVNQDGVESIKIFFGQGAEEEIKVADEKLKNEFLIF